jgi:glycosyltransferase involved in cell wall biosynthesis
VTTLDISVVIPTRNRAHLVGHAIRSALDQRRPAREIVVVDDGSEDDTAGVVARFGPPVRYLRQTPSGPAAARHAGFLDSTGASIVLLDSDDVMLPGALEALGATLDARPEVGVAYGWYAFIDTEGRPTSRGGPRLPGVEPLPWGEASLIPCGTRLEGQILDHLLLEETMLMGTALIRREWMQRIGGFEDTGLPHQEHWNFYLSLARAGAVYACCRQVVALIRLHDGNRAQQDLDRACRARLAVLDRYLKDAEPALPLGRVRSRAYYNACVETAILQYKHGHGQAGARWLVQAVRHAALDPRDFAELTHVIAASVPDRVPGASPTGAPAHHDVLPPGPELRRLRQAVDRVVRERRLVELYRDHGLAARTLGSILGAVWRDPSLILKYGRRRIRALGSGSSAGMPVGRRRRA